MGNVIIDTTANITLGYACIVVFFKFQSDVAGSLVDNLNFLDGSVAVGTPLFALGHIDPVEAKLWGGDKVTAVNTLKLCVTLFVNQCTAA